MVEEVEEQKWFHGMYRVYHTFTCQKRRMNLSQPCLSETYCAVIHRHQSLTLHAVDTVRLRHNYVMTDNVKL